MNVRDRFFYEIYGQVKSGEDVSLVSTDLGAPSLDDFRRDFPQRFVNVGIAEQNAIAVAGGLCLAGKKVVAYGLNPFPVTRAFDQIRNLMASLKLPITVAALKAGTATAEAGVSHMALENISLLRTLKNIRIINPSDETISKMAVDEMINRPAPRYIQFDPFITDILYDETKIDYNKGFALNGPKSDVAIVATGIWAHRLKKEDLPVRLIDCFALPLCEKEFYDELKQYKRIIAVEDGIDRGGIGSMTLEILNDYEAVIPVECMALKFDNGYPSVLSDRNLIFEQEGLTLDNLKKKLEDREP